MGGLPFTSSMPRNFPLLQNYGHQQHYGNHGSCCAFGMHPPVPLPSRTAGMDWRRTIRYIRHTLNVVSVCAFSVGACSSLEVGRVWAG